MINIQYIVVGTGRCGTLYTANLLTSLGIPCGHEAIFTPKGPDYEVLAGNKEPISSDVSKAENLSNDKMLMADASYMAAPFLGLFDAQVIHIVRNPKDVIRSFVVEFNYFSGSEPRQEEPCPEQRFVN